MRRLRAAPAARTGRPGDPADPLPQAAAAHITNTSAVSRTSVLLRDAHQELAQRDTDQVAAAWDLFN
jgi:hypothetical protein